jgi:hypothetical protein
MRDGEGTLGRAGRGARRVGWMGRALVGVYVAAAWLTVDRLGSSIRPS